MELNRRDINTLSRFLQDQECLQKRFGSALTQWLVDNYGDLFRQQGQICSFSSEQKRRLRDELQKDYPRFDWLQGLETGLERLAVTARLNQEKLADIRPDDDFVLVRQRDGLMHTCGLDLQLPPQSSLRLPVELLLQTPPKQILVVENLDVFDHWQRACVADDIADSLLVYRGHNRLNSGLKKLLTQLPSHTQVIMFSDLDPKGLEIAISLPMVTHMLLPANRCEQLIMRSSPGVFKKQGKACAFLRRQLTNGWQPWTDWVLSGRLAIMQQHFLQMGTELISVPR
ncbi:DUF7281 domain-containing protein [Bowmanella denitrificans]|uniref:DUF7281 domain-containing protein n=1 Tax=Bowmanella denitrificans TaxID=366582 RepID=UPI000C9C2862|nr:hypothetical protein [Bowmanella denitrificans]